MSRMNGADRMTPADTTAASSSLAGDTARLYHTAGHGFHGSGTRLWTPITRIGWTRITWIGWTRITRITRITFQRGFHGLRLNADDTDCADPISRDPRLPKIHPRDPRNPRPQDPIHVDRRDPRPKIRSA